jgi:hypothetical protein
MSADEEGKPEGKPEAKPEAKPDPSPGRRSMPLMKALDDARAMEESGGDASSVSEEAVSSLMELGVSRTRALRALRETGGHTDSAAMWLFSGMEDDVGDDLGYVLCAFVRCFWRVYSLIVYQR